MAFQITSIHVVSRADDFPIEIDVNFSDETGTEPTDYARVTVHVENRDQPLSDLKAQAIRKAKDFLSRALSSLPD